VGRTYEAVIRVNSQSGKGGVAYVMKFEHGLELPRRLQVEFSGVIQRIVERTGTEISAEEIWTTFAATYLDLEHPLAFVGAPALSTDGRATVLEAVLRLHGVERRVQGRGAGPVNAAVDALRRGLGLGVEVLDLHEQVSGEGPMTLAVACVEGRVGAAGSGSTRWGVGRDAQPAAAAVRAVVGLVNRG
jgi:2-isopropylmalate synthase